VIANVMVKKNIDVKHLKVSANVRYWGDSEINGEMSDDEGEGVPFKNAELWEPVIDVDKGAVCDWPIGTVAKFHFKVCDAGSYYLLDDNFNELLSRVNNYVPDGLCHGDEGYGDYIIFDVGQDGCIVNYSNKINIEDWEGE
jgi:hypothetical protein